MASINCWDGATWSLDGGTDLLGFLHHAQVARRQLNQPPSGGWSWHDDFLPGSLREPEAALQRSADGGVDTVISLETVIPLLTGWPVAS